MVSIHDVCYVSITEAGSDLTQVNCARKTLVVHVVKRK